MSGKGWELVRSNVGAKVGHRARKASGREAARCKCCIYSRKNNTLSMADTWRFGRFPL